MRKQNATVLKRITYFAAIKTTNRNFYLNAAKWKLFTLLLCRAFSRHSEYYHSGDGVVPSPSSCSSSRCHGAPGKASTFVVCKTQSKIICCLLGLFGNLINEIGLIRPEIADSKYRIASCRSRGRSQLQSKESI